MVPFCNYSRKTGYGGRCKGSESYVHRMCKNVHKMCIKCAHFVYFGGAKCSPVSHQVSHQCLTSVSPVSHQCLTSVSPGLLAAPAPLLQVNGSPFFKSTSKNPMPFAVVLYRSQHEVTAILYLLYLLYTLYAVRGNQMKRMPFTGW